MKNCVIKYFRVQGKTAQDKLDWLASNKGMKFNNIPFEHIQPDKNNNWINLTNNDWDNLIALNKSDENVIFSSASIGIATNRDSWVFSLDYNNLIDKINYFCQKFNQLLKLNDKSFNDLSIKWSETLKKRFLNSNALVFDKDFIKKAAYRPFVNKYYYTDKLLSDRLTNNHYLMFGSELQFENKIIALSSIPGRRYFATIATNKIPECCLANGLDGTQCASLYRYDSGGNRIDNITDWGLEQFRERYEERGSNGDGNEENRQYVGSVNEVAQQETSCPSTHATRTITKDDIFHYVYGVLHNPAYRKKYEMNLKREFPRVPFYEDFWQWASWGKELMDLHINFETVEPYPLEVIEQEFTYDREPKAKLKADKTAGTITLDEKTILKGIPSEVWEYKLGNRSALEWILDQYKEKKPKDPTIAEKFNTYRFADYKSKVIDLLMRVTTVSIETVRIIKAMEKE